MPIFKFGDSTVVDRSADGDLALPVLSVYGLMRVEGFITLPLLSIVSDPQTIASADFTLPCVSISGAIGISAEVNGSVSIPCLTVHGNLMAECGVELFPISVLGVVVSDGFCVGSITLPVIQVAGDSLQLVVVNGTVGMPIASLHGQAVSTIAAAINASIAIPAVRLVGIIISDAQVIEGSDRLVNYVSNRRYI